MPNSIHVDSVGRSDGLALLWNDEIGVDVQSCSKHHIDVFVVGPKGVSWRFTGFYGNPDRSLRSQSWTLLKRLNDAFTLPWMVGGDFNEILLLSKKRGGSDRCYSSMEQFGEMVANCGLVDLGFSGPIYTWRKNQGGGDNVEERLDRFLASDKWKDLFPIVDVAHLDFFGSDHRVIVASLDGSSQCANMGKMKKRRFLFEPLWMTNFEFKEVMWRSWVYNGLAVAMGVSLIVWLGALRNLRVGV